MWPKGVLVSLETDHQTRIEIEWHCIDILGDAHSRRQTINLTAYVRQFENTSTRYEQPPMDVISNALIGIKGDATKIHKDLQRLIRSSRTDRDAQENNDDKDNQARSNDKCHI